MSQKVKVSEVVVLAGLAAFAYWRYSKMTVHEKEKVYSDIKEIGEKVIKELLPEGIKGLLPSFAKS
ncbi:hypothetical protein [Segetibacter aerophilus]|uniref:Uncharacterized protein n=1 Tax=Segetibacter aerophilus TaxID=670293 RepID=A0A512B7E1_9BACT|nr:hypothetical protein [Segetibacter aerophilus]GEO07849.1 hypothetical protein SAE01_03450 [Segetibacter aerophilus]